LRTKLAGLRAAAHLRVKLEAELLQELPAELLLHGADVTLGEKIAKGGSGCVIVKGMMRAQVCAVKVLSTKGRLDVLRETKKELVVLGTLQHVNLLGCLGFVLGEEWRICMEYCPSTLRDAIQGQCIGLDSDESTGASGQLKGIGQSFEPKLAGAYALQLARGIAHLHAAGFVHRDVKPENLLISTAVDEVLGAPCLKLADFGTTKDFRAMAGSAEAKTMPPARCRTNSVCGTPEYFSPLRFAFGESHGFETDLWAYGLVLLELLAPRPGTHPWDERLFLTQIEEEVPLSHLCYAHYTRPHLCYAHHIQLSPH